MKKQTKVLGNNRGIATLAIATLIMMSLMVVGFFAVANSNLNMNAASNIKKKIQTFYAADAVTTMLSQEIFDGNESRYLRPDTTASSFLSGSCILGAITKNALNFVDNGGILTLQGGGNSVRFDNDPRSVFAYGRISKPTLDIRVRVDSLKGTNGNGGGGVMIRQNLTNGAPYAALYLTPGSGIYFSRRKTVNGTCTYTGYAPTPSLQTPYWLRLMRYGDIVISSFSADGVQWMTLKRDSVPFASDSIYAGIAFSNGDHDATSGNGVFTNFSSIDYNGSGTATIALGVGGETIAVDYNLIPTGTDHFAITADARQSTGTSVANRFNTRLNQDIVRNVEGYYQPPPFETAMLPVTLYDYSSDSGKTDFMEVTGFPYFNIYAPGEARDNNYVAMINMVESVVDGDRKPIRNSNDTLVRRYIKTNNPGRVAFLDNNAAVEFYKTTFDNFSDITGRKQRYAHWYFSDSIKNWFRPSGMTPDVVFDPASGRYTNLVKHVRAGDTMHNEWVGRNFDPTKINSSIVIYDSLEFRRQSGTDSRLFSYPTKIAISYAGKNLLQPTDWTHYTHNEDKDLIDSPTTRYHDGMTRFGGSFFPLRGWFENSTYRYKGFGFDLKTNTSTTDPLDFAGTAPAYNAPRDSQRCVNYSYTLEFHRQFVYLPGDTFSFTGDDDVWVFVNGQKVIDIGGTHEAINRMVFLDTIGYGDGATAGVPCLKPSKVYWLDFFYAERRNSKSNMLIQTTINLWTPPVPLQRSWKRDYGIID